MDRYFYSIEDYGNGKEIHISGNVYFNDVDESETDYRIAEWVGFSLTIAELTSLLDKEDFIDYINERIDYLADITKEEALDICNTYWNGESGIELNIREVNENTPCGYYWYELFNKEM